MKLTKATIISGLILCSFGLFTYQTIQKHYKLKRNIANAKLTYLATQQELAVEKKRHPTVKQVSTNYQRALTTANKYKNLSLKLTQLNTDSKQHTKVLQQLQDLVLSDDDATLIYNNMLTSWQIAVNYGGETSNNTISMQFRFTDKHSHKLMKVINCYYNVNSNVLSGFVVYDTPMGIAAGVAHEHQVKD